MRQYGFSRTKIGVVMDTYLIGYDLIDSNDELFVTEIAQRPDAAWIGFDTECSNWLGEHL